MASNSEGLSESNKIELRVLRKYLVASEQPLEFHLPRAELPQLTESILAADHDTNRCARLLAYISAVDSSGSSSSISAE